MSLQVFYTPRSKESLESVYRFILDRFGELSAGKFISKADKTINLISQQPFIFKASDLDQKNQNYINYPPMFFILQGNRDISSSIIFLG